MDDEWPPSAPHSKEDFKKAHDADQEKAPLPAPEGIVTKQKIEELENQIKKTVPQPTLTPRWAVPDKSVDQERIERFERLKQRMQQTKVQDGFNRARVSRER